MLSTRNVVLSKSEVCEAIRAFVRTKYHEKIEKGYELSDINVNDNASITFTFEEVLNPFVKSPKVKSNE